MDAIRSELPIYHQSLDWNDLFSTYPVPDVFEKTVFRWPRERLRQFQNKQFLKLMEVGWRNEFYSRRWKAAGLTPGDIRSIDDIAKFYARTTGIKAADFIGTAKSFSVEAQMRNADTRIQAYGTESTPTIVVQGKYRVTGASAGGIEQLIQLVNYLVAKETVK